MLANYFFLINSKLFFSNSKFATRFLLAIELGDGSACRFIVRVTRESTGNALSFITSWSCDKLWTFWPFIATIKSSDCNPAHLKMICLVCFGTPYIITFQIQQLVWLVVLHLNLQQWNRIPFHPFLFCKKLFVHDYFQ